MTTLVSKERFQTVDLTPVKRVESKGPIYSQILKALTSFYFEPSNARQPIWGGKVFRVDCDAPLEGLAILSSVLVGYGL